MSTIAWPGTAPFVAARWESGYDANVFVSQSPLSGDVQSVAIPGDRFRARVTIPAGTHAERAQLEGLFASLRCSQTFSANRLQIWHLARPTPRGTVSGSPTVQAVAAQLTTSVSITTPSAGMTFLRGDMIGFPNQTCIVTADATANGSSIATVSIAAPLRSALAIGDAVTLTQPKMLMLVVGMPMWGYDPGSVGTDQVTIDLMEVFA